MGSTRYEAEIAPQNYLRVRIVTERPRQVADFTVQYETVIDGVTYPVVRYDCAHGYAHRDLLDADGRNVDKLWLAGWDLTRALNHAISDIRANWMSYRAEFLARLR